MVKIRTIIDKEWAEVFKNRMVLFTVLFMPLLFTALALGVVLATGGAEIDDAAAAELPGNLAETMCVGLSGSDCFTFYLASQFMILFMMVPLIIPVTIAAYSIVGEKTTRSLEPLLATPISTAELLAGKALSAIIPAVVATWLAFGLYLIGAKIRLTDAVFGALTGPLWLFAIFLVGPLLAIMSVTIALMVSSRVTDPRAAEQLSAVVIVPILALFFGQVAGFLIIDQDFVLVLIAILAVLDVVLLYLAVRVFQRETILTKWK